MLAIINAPVLSYSEPLVASREYQEAKGDPWPLLYLKTARKRWNMKHLHEDFFEVHVIGFESRE